MNKVALITITYNSDEFLPIFIDALENTNINLLELSLFVVDNASKKDPEDYFEGRDIKVSFIKNRTNLGVSVANNQGAEAALNAGSDFVIFLNNDIDFDADLISNCVKISGEKDAIVSPRIYSEDGKIWYENGIFNKIKGWTGEHCKSNTGQFIQEVEYMPTCFACIPSEMFREIGGFDPQFFVYFDDTDFMYRAKKIHNKNLLVIKKLRLIHRIGGVTGGIFSNFTAYQTSKNRLLFIKKHFGTRYFALFSAIFLAYYIILVLSRKRTIDWGRHAFKGTFSSWCSNSK